MTDITYYKGQIGAGDINFGTGTFNRRDKDKSWSSENQVNENDLPRKVTAKTANYTIGTENRGYFTNTGATGTITFTLPTANVGKGPFLFVISAAYQINVDPDGTDYFRDCAAGKYKYSDQQGNILVCECFVAGIWEWHTREVAEGWYNET